MSSFSVVIPVKDGARYLREVLTATLAELPDEILVIDSGSTDGSLEIAEAAGVTLLRIPPSSFGHGRSRNLGMERTSGDLVAFLTQDATPCEGWLSAYREAFALGDDVGASFGPHLPRPGTSPMIARELTEFFATFSPSGEPRLQRAGDPSFLSNVNACYRRGCWETIRFRDVAYAEDQAFGVDLLAAGWTKVYQPAARVLHAHDYGLIDFMRRYFDEYRGLSETMGHKEAFSVRATLRATSTSVARDRRWMNDHGIRGPRAALWLAHSAAHHGGRPIFSALGSHSDQLPPAARRWLSLERRNDADPDQEGSAPAPPVLPPGKHVAPSPAAPRYHPVTTVWRNGPTPLRAAPPGLAERRRLRLALVIPPFARGSGGHNTLMQLMTRLERRGHVCSVWVTDYEPDPSNALPSVLRHDLREFFAPFDGGVHRGFDDWIGADVAIATGWQTVHPVLTLSNCHSRAYIVNDHEVEFFGASTQREVVADSYRRGLHCIAASPWLRDVLIARYGASADDFPLGVDHDDYQPRRVGRRGDTVIYYARPSTPRRAVPIGLMALEELHRRRPDLRIVLFGTREPVATSFPHEHLGILSPRELSWLYSEATVGLCLSLTNFSLMPTEMMACGLPCVELSGVSAESVFGPNGPIELAPLRPELLADAMQRMLEDRKLWEERSRSGREFVADRTWDRATDQVESGLRRAVRMQEPMPTLAV